MDLSERITRAVQATAAQEAEAASAKVEAAGLVTIALTQKGVPTAAAAAAASRFMDDVDAKIAGVRIAQRAFAYRTLAGAMVNEIDRRGLQ